MGRRPDRLENRKAKKQIAYYIDTFPCLSETFIQREVAALLREGLALQIFSHSALDREELSPAGLELLEKAHYLPRVTSLSTSLRREMWSQPLASLRTLAFLHTSGLRSGLTASGAQSLLARAVVLAIALKDCGADHVHSPWAFPAAGVALLASRFLGIEYSVQARASDLYQRDVSGGLKARLSNAAFIVTNADYNLPQIRETLSHKASPPVHRIYEGIDLGNFEPIPPRSGKLCPARILCVARLVEPKGIQHLLHALSILKARGCSFRTEIVGGRVPVEVNHFVEIKRLHRRLGLEEEVAFMGAMPFEDVLDRYRWADLVVLAAVEARDGRRDITPNTLIEAGAMGVPVVSTRSGAIPEIVEDEGSGILVAPGDPDALADAVERLIDDSGLRNRFASRGRQLSEESFDIQRNIKNYMELFQ